MSKIKRKMLFRDLLKQLDAITVIEFIHHLGIGPIGQASHSGKYSLVQRTLNALVDDGIVSKLDHGNEVRYELRYRNRETSTREEIWFDRWEDALSDKHGWYKFEDLRRITGSVTTKAINRCLTTEFINYVNDRNQITIRAKENYSSTQRYYIESDTDDSADRYSHLKEQIPAYPELIDVAARRGRSPSVAAAAVEWLCTDATQREAAEKYDCTTVGIRNNTDWVKKEIETVEAQVEAEATVA